jgi:hypothetical protein
VKHDITLHFLGLNVGVCIFGSAGLLVFIFPSCRPKRRISCYLGARRKGCPKVALGDYLVCDGFLFITICI